MNNSEQILIAQITDLVHRAQILLDRHDNEPAQALVTQARALDPDCSLRHPVNVLVQTHAALLALRRSDNGQSAHFADSALALACALDEPQLQAHAHLAVARASLAVGDIDHALAMLEASWPVVRDGRDLTLRYWYQTNFAVALAELDQSAESKGWYQEAATTAQEQGSERLIALAAANLTSAWLDLAVDAHDRGDEVVARHAWQTALDTANESLPLTRRAGIDRWITIATFNRFVALGALGHEDEALAGIAQVRSHSAVSDWPDFLARTHYNMAKILCRRGDLQAASDELTRGERVCADAQARSVLLITLELAGRVAELSGDLARALSFARRHHALYVELAADRATMRSKLLSVRLATERAKTEAASERNRRIALSEMNLALETRAANLRHEATHDALTGLSNRRELDEALVMAYADAVTNRKPLWLAMVDIDHFKAINDNHSHIVGDRVLRQLGALLGVMSRDRDIAARYGGEEFVVVLGDVKPRQAAAVAERLRQSIQDFDWASVAPGLKVTASLGVCDIARAPDPISGLLLADRLLYEAKVQGRNRVVCQQVAE